LNAFGVSKKRLEHFAHVIDRARVCHGPHQVVESSLLLELGLSLKHMSMNARASGVPRLKRALLLYTLASCPLLRVGPNSLLHAAVDPASFGTVNIFLERTNI